MAAAHDHITPEQAALIRSARVFFVASADPALGAGPDQQGPVNLSPKGGTPLHLLDERRVAYLDYRGSANETARHAEAGGPVTVMVMSMDGEDAAVVRLYGHATVRPLDEGSPLAEPAAEPAAELGEQRQLVEIAVESTHTSCGYGVPILSYAGERSREQRGRRYK
ncbi:MAG: pyridoxamine 5'-phosphate oxidase family protein [Chloroflexi bacterium]|nr:pyridoxamine 5'-phosphate oxidase family protein [Chloroflexota bacterium]